MTKTRQKAKITGKAQFPWSHIQINLRYSFVIVCWQEVELKLQSVYYGCYYKKTDY